MELVCAGFGEDFDAAEAEAFVLGGVGILVDADLADGAFGWKAAAGEAVDVDLRGMLAVAAGDGEDLLLECGVVAREGVELVFFEDEGAGVISRGGAV